MTTTCQQIYVRARNSAPANAAINVLATDVLARIDAEQQALFAELSVETRDRFQTTATLTSTSGASGRVFTLSGLSPVVERVLQVTLGDGREAHQVDVLDVDAELAPRYLVRGQQLIEIGNDWSAVSGPTHATVVYVYGPTAITANTDYTQLVSVPDAWADLLVLPLRLYLVGLRAAEDRDPNEIAQITTQLASRRAAFLAYLASYGGVESRRFVLPKPPETGKQ